MISPGREKENLEAQKIVQINEQEKKINLEYSTIQNVEDISFLFENDNQDSTITKQLRRKAFAKFKNKNNHEESQQQSKSVLELFDEIFKMKNVAIGENQSENSKMINQQINDHETVEDKVQQLQELLNQLNFSNDLQDQNPEEFFSIPQLKDFQNIHAQQEITPVFLRKLRYLNSIYPNFDHPQINHQKQNANFRSIVNQCESVLNQLSITIKNVEKKNEKITTFTSNVKNIFTIHYFMNSRWQQFKEIKNLERMKPEGIFNNRKVSFPKIKEAIQNYLQILHHYKKIKQFGFDRQEQRKNYWDFRQKFWDIERNIKLISQDIYKVGIRSSFPDHYHEFYKVLKYNLKSHPGPEVLENRRKLFTKILILQSQRQPLACSEIGQSVKRKIDYELRHFL